MAKVETQKKKKIPPDTSQRISHGIVSSTFQIVRILVHSHFELVSWLLALEATEETSEPVTQMALALINDHLLKVQQKR